MSIVLADRVMETSTSTGTGAFQLNGAVAGYQSFLTAFGSGSATQTYYTIAGDTEWEVGIGTFDGSVTPKTLTRNTILSSSNSGAAVPFGAGTKTVFVVYPAPQAVIQPVYYARTYFMGQS